MAAPWGALGLEQRTATKENLETEAAREQQRGPGDVVAIWQHFVVRVKDFRSSFTLLVGGIDITELVTGLG